MTDKQHKDIPALTRRNFMQKAAAVGVAGGLGGHMLGALAAETATLPFANGQRDLVKYPEKRPLLLLTTRPPQLETPFEVFNEGVITPNDAFFVRYHLANIPTSVDPETYRIKIGGLVNTPLELSLNDLKTQFEPIEYIAVNQCSGNSRGFFEPRVNGGQAGNGLMGNAKWRGVPLHKIMEKAGIQKGGRQMTFDGLDAPVLPATPDYIKAFNIDDMMADDVMLAYSMNGEDLPMLNGYPVRLIVPGWYGTIWVKHVSEIKVIDDVFNGFFMNPAYRIADNACACVAPGTTPKSTVPINRFDVRSFITNLHPGARVKAGRETPVRGIAFDAGFGITDVAVSADGGRTWRAATLGKDMGKYSFREWMTSVRLPAGTHEIMVRATNRIGQSQPIKPLWNPTGYMRNVVESVQVKAT
jgi:DMSO/TMAO reductase YedYZ molybdopterin-dependent catalytic subunit